MSHASAPLTSTTRANSAQGFAEQALRRGRAELLIGAQLGEHRPDLALAEAEIARGRKNLGVCVDHTRRDGATVLRAVGVSKGQRSASVAFDDELAAVMRLSGS